MPRLRLNEYARFVHDIDLDAFEEAIGFNPLTEGTNAHGEPEDIGQCPLPLGLHKNGDTTGKFAINRERRVYNCFVCGGGSLLDLTMIMRDISDQEAEEWIKQFAGFKSEQTDADFLSEIDAILADEKKVKEEIPQYNERLLDKWADLSELDTWLKERGISDDVACKARLGFQKDALRLGPVRHDQERKQPYNGPCVYLPHFWNAKLVGWQQRWLSEDRPKWIPKYTNTSGFPKSETIYNFENEFLAPRPIIICESVPTVLFLKSLGYPAVATFGGSVTEEQLRLLRYFQQGVVIAPDNDPPGFKWLGYTQSERIALDKGRRIDRIIMVEYLARFIPVSVIEPFGQEGDDLANLLDGGIKWAAETVEYLYNHAIPYM